MSLSIDPCTLEKAAAILNDGIKNGSFKVISAWRGLNGAFTNEPGLRNLGEQHLKVINGDKGSAAKTLFQLTELIR